MKLLDEQTKLSIVPSVQISLAEDIGSGDITAQLINEESNAVAKIITREDMIMCGKAWVDEVFYQVDPDIRLTWFYSDGDNVLANEVLFTVYGRARSLVTAERTALNFLQLLSGVATSTSNYAEKIKHTSTKLLDTRKTIVGLRLAQKYAVLCGGGYNHRIGLYDAFLIKENHITACGSITKAIEEARKIAPSKSVEVEVTNIDELQEAIAANVDIVMLDNFDLEMMKEAVLFNDGRIRLEVSGNIILENIESIANIGVDYISVGAITKHLKAVDLSMGLELL
ncbi:MAG: carboxylating nicotinate-nucleotide diphosphorylase [Burkholderiales bacterium]|nr:carboxylating nicotinate-nucleotide diphosphorylase [Burkholderiales bacterium]